MPFLFLVSALNCHLLNCGGKGKFVSGLRGEFLLTSMWRKISIRIRPFWPWNRYWPDSKEEENQISRYWFSSGRTFESWNVGTKPQYFSNLEELNRTMPPFNGIIRARRILRELKRYALLIFHYGESSV